MQIREDELFTIDAKAMETIKMLLFVNRLAEEQRNDVFDCYCEGNCSGGCAGHCEGTCVGSCTGECYGGCSGSCEGGCVGGSASSL